MKCSIDFTLSLEKFVHNLTKDEAHKVLTHFCTTLLLSDNTSMEEPLIPLSNEGQLVFDLITELISEKGKASE